MPIYDRTRELKEAVWSLLAQTEPSYEILLVADGSPSQTRQIIAELATENPDRINVFSFDEPFGTACRARNLGIQKARGDYVCFLDSDDLSPPQRLEATRRLIEERQVDVVFGSVSFLCEGSRQIEGIAFGDEGIAVDFSFDDLWIHNRIYMLTAAIRRSVLLRHGGFRPEMRYREDYELWLRLLHHGCTFGTNGDVLGVYRIHAGNNELNFKNNDLHWEQESKRLYCQPFKEWGV